MGFWSSLAKIGTSLIPGVGPVASKVINGIGTAGDVAAHMAAGRGQGRVAEAAANNAHDQTALDFARLNLQAPGMRAHSAVQGDILAGVQPASVSGRITGTNGMMPKITGGLNPGLLSQNTRALGGQMSRQALLSQMGPQPSQTTLPEPGKMDAILNLLGYGQFAKAFPPITANVGSGGVIPNRANPVDSMGRPILY